MGKKRLKKHLIALSVVTRNLSQFLKFWHTGNNSDTHDDHLNAGASLETRANVSVDRKSFKMLNIIAIIALCTNVC